MPVTPRRGRLRAPWPSLGKAQWVPALPTAAGNVGSAPGAAPARKSRWSSSNTSRTAAYNGDSSSFAAPPRSFQRGL